MSRGLLQFQDALWSDTSRASGITGSPDDPQAAIPMAEYAVEHGELDRWTCGRILGIVRR
jgi:hypothetical protein